MGDISQHFSRYEMTCSCGCGFDTADYKLIDVLEALRFWAARPVEVLSGCRCKRWNKVVGGSKKSQHMQAKAADITIDGIEPKDIVEWLNFKYPDSLGVGLYPTWVHIDVRDGKARWEE